MVDNRIKELARILTDYSIEVKKGDIIELNFDIAAKELALECYKNLLKKGALPATHINVPGFGFNYFNLATEEQLKAKPKVALFEAKLAAGSISIGGEWNSKELTNIDPKKLALRRKVTEEISNIYVDQNNWVICEFPTNALAQDAEMSLEEFEDFAYSATNQNWEELSKKQDKLKKILDEGKIVRIKAPDTDITFSIQGRQGIKCDGHRNMPDGEVFIAPVEDTTEGYIKYTYPAIYSGREVSGVFLNFHEGKVIEAKADKGEDMLKEMISTDEGACKLGEFGIGVNYGIKKFIKQILFDEKIGGTIHLALGRAYKEGGGKNKSAIHWDMIKDMKNGGELYIDGKLIQKNGKFTFDL